MELSGSGCLAITYPSGKDLPRCVFVGFREFFPLGSSRKILRRGFAVRALPCCWMFDVPSVVLQFLPSWPMSAFHRGSTAPVWDRGLVSDPVGFDSCGSVNGRNPFRALAKTYIPTQLHRTKRAWEGRMQASRLPCFSVAESIHIDYWYEGNGQGTLRHLRPVEWTDGTRGLSEGPTMAICSAGFGLDVPMHDRLGSCSCSQVFDDGVIRQGKIHLSQLPKFLLDP